jgi:AcrR family transcriptional regulator
MQISKVTRKAENIRSPRERIIDAARKLFDAKGFHATTTAELATEAAVSIGQIYRHFEAKDDIVIAIAEHIADYRVAQNDAVFNLVERGELSMFGAIKAIAELLLCDPEEGLFFEVLAESCRNPSVAARMGVLIGFYREGIRRLAALARPDAPVDEIDAFVDLMMASFVGLCYRPGMGGVANVEKASHNIAALAIRALGLAEPPQGGAASVGPGVCATHGPDS